MNEKTFWLSSRALHALTICYELKKIKVSFLILKNKTISKIKDWKQKLKKNLFTKKKIIYNVLKILSNKIKIKIQCKPETQ